MAWVFLFGAVFLEVVATNVLPATQRFTRPVPTVTVCLMYAGTALLLARAILGIDLAIAYTCGAHWESSSWSQLVWQHVVSV